MAATAVLFTTLLILSMTLQFGNCQSGGNETDAAPSSTAAPTSSTVAQASSSVTLDEPSSTTALTVQSSTTVLTNTLVQSSTTAVTLVQTSTTALTNTAVTNTPVQSSTTASSSSVASTTAEIAATTPTPSIVLSSTITVVSSNTATPMESSTAAMFDGDMSTEPGSGDSTTSMLMPSSTIPETPAEQTTSSITEESPTAVTPSITPSITPISSTSTTLFSTPILSSTVVTIPPSPSSTASPPTTTTSVAPSVAPSRSATAEPGGGESPAAAVAGVLVTAIIAAVIAVVIILLIVFLMRRRKNKRSYELEHLLEGTDGTELKELSFKPSCKVNLDALFAHIPVTEAILMTDLEQHMTVMESEDGKEFYTVQENDSEDFPITAAKTSANFDKNRYINILPFDQTRVMLVDLPRMPGSNYINANYIAGYNSKTEYIATQGPIAATIPDFWRMIWEQGTRNIVMVTNPVEGGITKCEVYWPRDGTAQKYGVVSVTNTKETVIPTCTIRKFTLAVAHNTKDQKQRQVMTREVSQFCYTGWPDMGVPQDASTMLKFVHRVRSAVQSDDGPIVVHCSAGVGRTGTYISIDVQLQRMKQEDNVNVQQFVMQMRAQRPSMVQTEPQYMFIYKAILYAYMYGITEIKKDELQKHIEKLQLAFPNTEDSRLDIEFCGATDVPDPDDEDMSVAQDPANADKNRKTSFLPFNENRLTLSDPESTGSDYINASFVGVLGRTKEYIIAEHPLPSIVPDYWKMILDRGINAIVIIGPIDNDKEVYWPLDEDPVEHDGITIQLLEHESEKGLSATMVEVECEETEQRSNVSILQLNSWPCDSGEVPPSTDGMVQLLGLVSQHATGKILVHSSCSLEDDASGVFCIANSLAKRLKDGGSVDVMKATTHLLTQRSNVIISKDQYFFIYETLQEVVSE